MNNDEQFYGKVDKMFEDKLFYEEVPVIRVKDLKTDKVLDNLDYDNLLRFDANLNMYKLHTDGTWILVNNENFKPIIINKEVHKKTSN